jgi:LAGLIDADG endonuclease
MHNDPWLAGFADGEGHFGINQITEHGFQPVFAITLRHDDWQILENIAAAFGGTVIIKRARRGREHDQLRYQGSSIATLDALKTYFDAHPLRTKKARDYEIWREAVIAYVTQGWRAVELAPLKERLTGVRVYAAMPA